MNLRGGRDGTIRTTAFGRNALRARSSSKSVAAGAGFSVNKVGRHFVLPPPARKLLHRLLPRHGGFVLLYPSTSLKLWLFKCLLRISPASFLTLNTQISQQKNTKALLFFFSFAEPLETKEAIFFSISPFPWCVLGER